MMGSAASTLVHLKRHGSESDSSSVHSAAATPPRPGVPAPVTAPGLQLLQLGQFVADAVCTDDDNDEGDNFSRP